MSGFCGHFEYVARFAHDEYVVALMEYEVGHGCRVKLLAPLYGYYVYPVFLADVEFAYRLILPALHYGHFEYGIAVGQADIVEDVVAVVAYGEFVRRLAVGIDNLVRADFF